LRAENVGSDRALNVVVEDALESAGTFVSGSLTVDGQPVSDASGDGLFIAQNTVRSDPFLLEARESKTFSFLTLKENQSTTLNQANIRATGIARRLSDADPTIAGAQPTRVQKVNSQEAQIASQALTLTDENGGLLAAGDNLVGHVLIAALDERLTFDASTRFVEFVLSRQRRAK